MSSRRTVSEAVQMYVPGTKMYKTMAARRARIGTLFILPFIIGFIFFMVVMGIMRVFMPAMKMSMEMRMFVFLAPMHLDGKMRRRNAALHRPFTREFDIRDAESVQCPHDRRRVGHQFQQGAREHVARRAHRTVKIKRLHSLRPPNPRGK